MKAIQLDRTGEPELLRLVELPQPVAGKGELLLRVEAVGVNFADTVRRRGDPYPMPTPLPVVLGGELCGTVVAVGEGVTGWSEGDRAIGLLDYGGYAEYAVVSAAMAIPIPADIEAALAAALFVQGMTALLVLQDVAGGCRERSVLIEGAAGGVGGLAVQIAQLLGARLVVGAVGSPDKTAAVVELGADACLIYSGADWIDAARSAGGGDGYDLILHMRGGSFLAEELPLLKPGGRLIAYGAASGQPALVDATALLGPNAGIIGFYLGGFLAQPELVEQRFRQLVQWCASGELAVPIGHDLPLEQAAEAHALLESRTTLGKIVLRP